jgi:hypothetical protein
VSRLYDSHPVRLTGGYSAANHAAYVRWYFSGAINKLVHQFPAVSKWGQHQYKHQLQQHLAATLR